RVRRFFALEESDSYSISSSSIEALQQHPQMSAPVRQMNRSNIVNLPLRRPGAQQIVLLEPSSFGEAREVAEALKQKKPIIVNVRKTDKDLARRIVDFLSGIAYAIDGHMTKIADSIYIFAPATVEIVSQGDQPDYQKEQDSLFNSGG
ncbi:MAG: cell division protein SepF, partial [Betaproteobacteria bacterium]|nr:cell division protein SepF [Betaproteobacteria bacterium]